MKSDESYREQVQKALQNNTWHENDKLCDWDWLFYRIRMGGNCIRFLANLHAMLHVSASITREDFLKLEDQFLKQTNEDYDSLLDEHDEKIV